ncbi:hypothetical protein [Cytophaga sp. FL35]|uniref:hypothetical protein n=1 Tax=Cytophaga sp. FL35 TaxID=1904456 RepID=UPI0016536AA6|nr:hypothetical protein [Cytophaga sp. FL35]MBC7000347.1 hypothetical protein [Cytophaga sp. FL35]
MIEKWLTEDHRIDLPKLFTHLGFKLFQKEATHYIFKGGGSYYVVLYSDKAYLYYTIERPEEKLSASDLITAYVSKTEGENKEMLWDKVDAFYNEVIRTEDLLISDTTKNTMETVGKDFNHFIDYGLPLNQNADWPYASSEDLGPFEGRIVQDKEGKVLFPLFNIQNEVCGYFADTDKGVLPFRESAITHSLWYSNIPKKIDGLFLFKDPKEALAFHRKFSLNNVVYLALGAINTQTTRILFQIQRLTKVDKLFLSFTGNKKLEGYLRDLHFISYVEDSDFKLSLTDRDMALHFPMGNEKSFSKFYNHTRQFNAELAQSFMKYNKIIDQSRLNRYSIMVSKDGEQIKVRLPLEANAIRLLVWSYYKNYLDKAIEILKPTSHNWYSEWESTEGQQQKGKEGQWKDYRIAM